VCLVLEAEGLEDCILPELHDVARLLDTSALELALSGGEDYALVATGAPERRPRWARRIGRVERGRGVVLEQPDGTRQPLAAGFEHR
jgi:thiamine monophosphate kinase